MAPPQCFIVAVHCLLLCVRTLAFKPIAWGKSSLSHGDITEIAILRKTAEVCQDLALVEGRPFSLTIDNSLTASRVLSACFPDSDPSLLSDLKFRASIIVLCASNWAVDLGHTFFISKYHFDDESFVEGRNLITEGVHSVKASVKMENFLSARVTLGTVFHTLQDFYSHSDWIEMKNKVPFSTLIQPNLPLENLADRGTPTCRDCVGGNCKDNILPEILNAKKLTSGYFGVFSSSKPKGRFPTNTFSLSRILQRRFTKYINTTVVSLLLFPAPFTHY
ncbi:von Willebrand factor A domain-containing protein 7-like [Arapaima gigas]